MIKIIKNKLNTLTTTLWEKQPSTVPVGIVLDSYLLTTWNDTTHFTQSVFLTDYSTLQERYQRFYVSESNYYTSSDPFNDLIKWEYPGFYHYRIYNNINNDIGDTVLNDPLEVGKLEVVENVDDTTSIFWDDVGTYCVNADPDPCKIPISQFYSYTASIYRYTQSLNNWTQSINNITSSFLTSASLSGYVTTSSFNQYTASQVVISASFDARIRAISSSVPNISFLVTTSSFNNYTQSINSYTASTTRDSASFDIRINAISSSAVSISGSTNVYAIFTSTNTIGTSSNYPLMFSSPNNLQFNGLNGVNPPYFSISTGSTSAAIGVSAAAGYVFMGSLGGNNVHLRTSNTGRLRFRSSGQTLFSPNGPGTENLDAFLYSGLSATGSGFLFWEGSSFNRSVEIIRPINPGHDKMIKIDQPNSRIYFYTGSTDLTGSGLIQKNNGNNVSLVLSANKFNNTNSTSSIVLNIDSNDVFTIQRTNNISSLFIDTLPSTTVPNNILIQGSDGIIRTITTQSLFAGISFDTSSLVTTSSFNNFTSSVNRDSASFDARINVLSSSLGSIPSMITVLSNTSVNTLNRYIFADATSGAVSLLLPSASQAQGIEFKIKKIDSSINNITITPSGSLIDGTTSKTITLQYAGLSVIASGSNYWIMGTF